MSQFPPNQPPQSPDPWQQPNTGYQQSGQYPPQPQWQGQPSQPEWPGQSPQPQWPGQSSPQPEWPGQSSQSPQPEWRHSNTGYQQPGQYPPQPMQPGMYPPPQAPLKKSRRGLWIAIGVVVVVLLALCVGVAVIINNAAKSVQTSINTTLTSVATSIPTSAATTAATSSTSGGTWTTTHTFTGNGTQKTVVFTVGSDWKITYACNGMVAGVAIDGILNVIVYGSNGSVIDPVAINATCKSGSALTKGEKEEHQGGQVYLAITGTGDWTVVVQELK